METPTEQLKVTITRIDFTFHRQLRLRLRVHPAREPLHSKFITLTSFQEHFGAAIAAIQKYDDFQ